MSVPLTRQMTMDITSLAASADFSAAFHAMPYAAQITLVQYVPDQTQTDDTGVANTGRTYALYNRQAANTGTTSLCRAFMTSASASIVGFGTSTSAGLTQNIASSLPLTTTALLTVAAGDILVWESSHIGSTGLRDVGGRVVVSFSRI